MTELKSLLRRSVDRVEPGAGSRCGALSTCCTSLIHCDLTLWYITDTPCTCNQRFRTCGSHELDTRHSLLSNFIFVRPASLYCEEYVYIQSALGLCMNWRCSQGLTTLPPSCVDRLEISEPHPSGTLRACPGL